MDSSIGKYCCLATLMLITRDLLAACDSFPEDLKPQCQTNLQTAAQSTSQLRSVLLSPDQSVGIDVQTIPVESPLIFSKSDIFISASSSSIRPSLNTSGNLLLDIQSDEIYLSGVQLSSHSQLVRNIGGEDFGLFGSILTINGFSGEFQSDETADIEFTDCEGHYRLENNRLTSSRPTIKLSANSRFSSQCLLSFRDNIIANNLELNLTDMAVQNSNCNSLSGSATMTCTEPPESGFVHFFNNQGHEFYCGVEPVTPPDCAGLTRPMDNSLSTGEIVIYTAVALVGIGIVVAFSVGTFGFLYAALNCGKVALSAAGSAPVVTEAARQLSEVVVHTVRQNPESTGTTPHEYDVIDRPYQTLELQPVYNTLAH